jgi:hypothetical protein
LAIELLEICKPNEPLFKLSKMGNQEEAGLPQKLMQLATALLRLNDKVVESDPAPCKMQLDGILIDELKLKTPAGSCTTEPLGPRLASAACHAASSGSPSLGTAPKEARLMELEGNIKVESTPALLQSNFNESGIWPMEVPNSMHCMNVLAKNLKI